MESIYNADKSHSASRRTDVVPTTNDLAEASMAMQLRALEATHTIIKQKKAIGKVSTQNDYARRQKSWMVSFL
jgi:hypothetical protein